MANDSSEMGPHHDPDSIMGSIAERLWRDEEPSVAAQQAEQARIAGYRKSEDEKFAAIDKTKAAIKQSLAILLPEFPQPDAVTMPGDGQKRNTIVFLWNGRENTTCVNNYLTLTLEAPIDEVKKVLGAEVDKVAAQKDTLFKGVEFGTFYGDAGDVRLQGGPQFTTLSGTIDDVLEVFRGALKTAGKDIELPTIVDLEKVLEGNSLSNAKKRDELRATSQTGTSTEPAGHTGSVRSRRAAQNSDRPFP